MKAFIGVFFMVCIYMDLAQGSCLSYGHSCWGGHGKRASLSRILRPQMEISDRWALVKLMPDKNDGFPTKDEGGLIREMPDNDEKLQMGNNIHNIENLPFLPNIDNEISQDISKNDLNKSKGTKNLNKIFSPSDTDDEDELNNNNNNNILPNEDVYESRNLRFYKMLRPLN